MFGNMMMYDNGGFSGFGLLLMFLFWALIILGIIAIIHYLGGSAKNTRSEKTPLDILKVRYAKGEIDKKEFEDKKKDLAK
jgi:putative membrane protein